MTKGKLLIEGKTKRLYESSEPEFAVLEFAGRELQRPADTDGEMYNRISARMLQMLESKGVATHFEKILSDREMLVKRLAMFPFQVVVRNKAAGAMAKSLGVEEGAKLACPVFEMRMKSDALGDPLINEYHVLALKIASEEEIKIIRERSFQVNNVLKHFFEERGLELVDFTLEFGRAKGKILLGDEITPDTCRLWETKTGRKLDRERFQQDLFGDAQTAYQAVLERVLKG